MRSTTALLTLAALSAASPVLPKDLQARRLFTETDFVTVTETLTTVVGAEATPVANQDVTSVEATSTPLNWLVKPTASLSTKSVGSSSSVVETLKSTSIVSTTPAASTSSASSKTTSVVSTTPAASTTLSTKTNASLSTSSNDSLSSSVSGEATFYGGNTAGGTCSFTDYTLPSGLFGTAFSGSAWDSAANCGACVKVTGPSGNSIVAMVTDQCPECDVSHLDLYQDAFEQLGSTSAGIISISYEFVKCGITTPLRVRNKSGTSAYFFSMQVVNSNVPVSKLEVSTDGGSTWTATTRRDYNFFEQTSGFGTDTVDVRITSSEGDTITVSDVSVSSGSEATASGNFA